MQFFPWPAYSPDMSPIEQVWYLVGRRLARDPFLAASKDELWLRILAVWNSLPQANIQKLFSLHAMSYNRTYCSAWCLHEILISDTIFENFIIYLYQYKSFVD